jgi:hypothetical protein
MGLPGIYYKCKSQEQSEEQSWEDIKYYHDMIFKSIAKIENGKGVLKYTAEQINLLKNAVDQVVSIKEKFWFPKFGCVLLVMTIAEECNYGLALLGLDLWKKEIYLNSDSDGVHHAECNGAIYEHLYSGPFETFAVSIKNILQMVHQDLTGKQKSAAGGQVGHQKTSSFVESCFKAAIKHELENGDMEEMSKRKKELPKGGVTDVGLHSGGKARNVCWPLVRETLNHFLGANNDPILMHMFLFEIHETNLSLEVVDPQFSSKKLDRLASILLAMEKCAEILAQDCAYDIVSARGGLVEDLIAAYANERQKRLQFDAMEDVLQFKHDHVDQKHCSSGSSPRNFRDLALSNIGRIDHFKMFDSDGKFMSFKDLHVWIKNYAKQDSTEAVGELQRDLLIMATIDRYVWSLADNLNCCPFSMTDDELVEAHQIMLCYNNATKKQIKAKVEISSASLRSNETLNTWILAAFMHKNAIGKCPLLGEYRLPLHRGDLKHLVLHTKESKIALLAVHQYLEKAETQASSDNYIFMIGKDKGTIDFYFRHAQQFDHVMKHWEIEQQDALSREKLWYEKILDKKAGLEILRSKLINKEGKCLEAVQDRIDTQYEWEKKQDGFEKSCLWNELQTKKNRVSNLNRDIDRIKKDIYDMNQVPNYVRHNLPSEKNLALPVLYDLFFMPNYVEFLSRFIFKSQELLFVDQAGAETGGSKITWFDIYKGRFSTQNRKESFSVLFALNHDRFPRNVGPQLVDDVHSSTDGTFNSIRSVLSQLRVWVGFKDG